MIQIAAIIESLIFGDMPHLTDDFTKIGSNLHECCHGWTDKVGYVSLLFSICKPLLQYADIPPPWSVTLGLHTIAHVLLVRTLLIRIFVVVDCGPRFVTDCIGMSFCFATMTSDFLCDLFLSVPLIPLSSLCYLFLLLLTCLLFFIVGNYRHRYR